MAFTVAIVGRPNVGKSTLFKRLTGRRLALVDDKPGSTRDRRTGDARLGDLRFTAIDTAGFEGGSTDGLLGDMRAQTERAVRDADVVLFVVDCRDGATSLDAEFARWLRRLARPVLLVANKCESRASLAGVGETHRLGFGAPIAISAEHGQGLDELREALRAHAPAPIAATTDESDDASRPIRLAIIGRPNVGKSTLVNRLLGDERMLTGPEPGVTRDAIESAWSWNGTAFRLVDTAGLRRKARIEEGIERMSTADALRVVRESQVCALVIDASRPIEKQDLQIARLVAEEGRALVIAINKWDLVDSPQATLRAIRDRLEISLPQVAGVRFATISALQGRKVDALMTAVIAAYERWNAELPTSKLNRWLEGVTQAHPPPIVKGRRPRLRFCNQSATRPPTIALFGNKLVELPDDYLRYLANSLRETFDLAGTVIRFRLRATKNPYVDA